MPKIDFTFIVHNGQPFIELNLKNIYSFANKIIIIEGPVKYYKDVLNYGESVDGTIEMIKSFPDPDNKIILEQGLWEEKDNMVKAQEKYFNGDYIWAIDADEFYKHEDIKKIFNYLDNNPECYSMSFRLRSFYGGFDRYISGFEENFEVHRIKKIIPRKSHWVTHRPPTMNWPLTNQTCKQMGHVNHITTGSWGIYIYHYSHLPPKRIKEKMDYYTSFSQTIQNYWERLYVPWLQAKTEEEKLAVEQPFLGVQEWTPDRRGPAFTVKFDGEHPKIIQSARQQIEQQIKKECKELGIW